MVKYEFDLIHALFNYPQLNQSLAFDSCLATVLWEALADKDLKFLFTQNGKTDSTTIHLDEIRSLKDRRYIAAVYSRGGIAQARQSIYEIPLSAKQSLLLMPRAVFHRLKEIEDLTTFVRTAESLDQQIVLMTEAPDKGSRLPGPMHIDEAGKIDVAYLFNQTSNWYVDVLKKVHKLRHDYVFVEGEYAYYRDNDRQGWAPHELFMYIEAIQYVGPEKCARVRSVLTGQLYTGVSRESLWSARQLEYKTPRQYHPEVQVLVETVK